MSTPTPDLDGLIGTRVALRHRVGLRDGRPLFTDAVGELADGGVVDGEPTVVVTTRRGPVVVARAAVVAVRAVPPPVPRRASWTAVARLESLCADALPALAERRLGGWRLRAAGGFTGRANAAVAVGDPGMPIPAALAAVREFAAAHDVPPRVLAPIGSPWSRAVAGEGWVLDARHEPGPEVAVLVADLARLADRPAAAAVAFAAEPTDAWWSLALGGPPSPAQRSVLGPTPALRHLGFGTADDDAGVVRVAVVEDHLHVSRLAVAAAARRRGVATSLLAGAARWGLDRGARWAVLQVALANTGALEFYERLGATEHHRYHYLVPRSPG